MPDHALRHQTSSEDVLPTLDAICQILFTVGGSENFRKCVGLAQVRVQLLCGAMNTPFSAILKDCSPSTHHRDVENLHQSIGDHPLRERLLRALVEYAHLLKHSAEFQEALHAYRCALRLSDAMAAGVKRQKDAAPLPYLKAIADVCLMMGAVEDAMVAYEHARTLADMKIRVDGNQCLSEEDTCQLCELEQCIALTLLYAGKSDQSAQLLAKVQRQIAAITVPTSTFRHLYLPAAAEVMLTAAFCCGVRDAFFQAKQYLASAEGYLEEERIDLCERGASLSMNRLLSACVKVVQGWLHLRILLLRSEGHEIESSDGVEEELSVDYCRTEAMQCFRLAEQLSSPHHVSVIASWLGATLDGNFSPDLELQIKRRFAKNDPVVASFEVCQKLSVASAGQDATDFRAKLVDASLNGKNNNLEPTQSQHGAALRSQRAARC